MVPGSSPARAAISFGVLCVLQLASGCVSSEQPLNLSESFSHLSSGWNACVRDQRGHIITWSLSASALAQTSIPQLSVPCPSTTCTPCSLLISQLVPGPSRPCWFLETWFEGNCPPSHRPAACLGPDAIVRFVLMPIVKTSVKYSIFTAGDLDSGGRCSLKKRLGEFF